MAFSRTSFVTLLLVCAANASQPLESARDQYKAHEDVPQPPQLLSEATDRPADVHQLHHIDPLIKNGYTKNSKVSSKIPSASASVKSEKEPTKSKNETQIKSPESSDLRKRRHIDISGLSANIFTPWTSTRVAAIVQVPPLQSFSIWQPQVHQISRPYFIPVWSAPGKLPFFFPPQPLYTNPGYPVHNPPKEYLPPNNGYLPPDTRTPAPPSKDNATKVPTFDKFGDDDGDGPDGGPGDRPVWDTVTDRPESGDTTIRPTRRPRPSGQRTTTHPPLVHNDNIESNSITTPSPSSGGFRPQTQRPPATQRPQRPPAAQRPQRPPATQRPQRPMETLRPPVQQPQLPSTSNMQPSRCVWAIISCCSGNSEDISYRCFEQLGCTGAFWDMSPCQSDFARAAIETVMNYYNTN